MALLERQHHLLNQIIRHDQLDLPFFHKLDHSALPDKWLTAIQRAELALAEHLPRALVVSAIRPAPAANTAFLTLSTWLDGTKKASLYMRLS